MIGTCLDYVLESLNAMMRDGGRTRGVQNNHSRAAKDDGRNQCNQDATTFFIVLKPLSRLSPQGEQGQQANNVLESRSLGGILPSVPSTYAVIIVTYAVITRADCLAKFPRPIFQYNRTTNRKFRFPLKSPAQEFAIQWVQQFPPSFIPGWP